ncbi:hypothetical protein SEA_SKOG_101 [Gordonia phage Skog]|uniref:Uncharacterized protein n=1 Tax=Gordonia phage Skog TaxID=2704033 RepID=A0A6G6XKF1_9CAUD|nr:hypothetical protein KHQ85_gp101 [Gordonia phage Skog]QIG58253.1 hypothetical protein SEA_SKOG_101 [Gordonia phage Skog]
MIDLDQTEEKRLPDWVQPGAQVYLVSEGSWADKGVTISSATIDRVLKRDIVGHFNVDDREVRWRANSFRTDDSIGHFGSLTGPAIYPVDTTSKDFAQQRERAQLTRLSKRYERALRLLTKAEKGIRYGYPTTDEQALAVADALDAISVAAADLGKNIRENKKLL